MSRQVTNQGLVCLLGPTGSGKSSMAIHIARKIAVQVVNFDSRQVYRDFPLITDQPGTEERGVCEHWLYGFLGCDQRLDAAGYSNFADQAISRIKASGFLPLLVGGTGLYLKALLEGLAPMPEIAEHVREEILNKCRAKGSEALHAELMDLDPETALRLHHRDRQRISRALEVYQATGLPLSWWQKMQNDNRPRYQALKIGIWPDMQKLESGLAKRIDRMLEQGALQEVRRAWRKCPNERFPAWSGIGCMELLDYIQGRNSLQEAKQRWLSRTKAYVKRQLTWFKKDKQVKWLESNNHQQALSLVLER